MCLFVSLRAKNGENKNCFSYPTCVYVVIMRSILILYSHSIFSFSIIFLSCISLLFCSLCYVLVLYLVVTAVFFADLPILLPSVGFSPLLCVIVRLGVFRGSEAKKLRFCVVVGLCVYGKRADETFVCPIRPMSLAGYACCVISCAGMMLCSRLGLLS